MGDKEVKYSLRDQIIKDLIEYEKLPNWLKYSKIKNKK